MTDEQAKTVVHYSNSFRLIDRLQSEDRAHCGGIDIMSDFDIDDHIVRNLRSKKNVAARRIGDSVSK